MGEPKLYKYFDTNVGVMMFYSGTLLFVSATQMNDSFDCHPAIKLYQMTIDPDAFRLKANLID